MMQLNCNTIIESILKELDLNYEAEYRFNPERKWKADYFIPSINTLLEIEGKVFNGGRHTRGSGFIKDTFKYNSASILGFNLLRYATNTIRDNPKQVYDDLLKLREVTR